MEFARMEWNNRSTLEEWWIEATENIEEEMVSYIPDMVK